jgi:uncharacterized protein with HEPN domain
VRDDAVYLRHIADSIDLVGQYLSSIDGTPNETLFYEDPRTQDAVLRRMETLADAAGRLSESLQSRHAHIPLIACGTRSSVIFPRSRQ